MTSLDLSRLSGPDAVVALRSYPRRFRAAIRFDQADPEAEERALRIGPSGHSALDYLVHATNTWVLFGQALHQLLVGTDPVMHPGVRDPVERAWEVPPGTTVKSALDRLAEEASALADAVSRVQTSDWERSGRVAGNGTITALDLVREAVRVGADDLRAIETTLAAV